MTALALLNANMGFNQSLQLIGAGVFTYITAAVHSHGQTGRIECWPTGMAFLIRHRIESSNTFAEFYTNDSHLSVYL